MLPGPPEDAMHRNLSLRDIVMSISLQKWPGQHASHSSGQVVVLYVMLFAEEVSNCDKDRDDYRLWPIFVHPNPLQVTSNQLSCSSG